MQIAVDGSDDQFAASARLYAAARPAYPAALIERMVAPIPRRKNALDVAAGSGQLSIMLCEYFDHVVATDKSEAQLAQAPRHPKITYQTGVATSLPEPDGTYFDLVACAQAYHWFVAANTDKEFLSEACRVLDPNHGRLAIAGYGICKIVSSPPLEEAFKKFYFEDLGSNLAPSSPSCFWDIDRRLVDNQLENINLHGMMEVADKYQTVEQRQMTVHVFLNYVRTFSALNGLRKECATTGKIDPMETLHNTFSELTKDDELLTVNFPFFLMSLKPAT